MYKCKVCNQNFSLLRYLRKHVTIPAVGAQQLNKCQSYYTEKDNLLQNLKINPKIVLETQTEEYNCKAKGQREQMTFTNNQEKTGHSQDDDSKNIENEHSCLKFEPDEQDELYFFDRENPIFPYDDIANNLPQQFGNAEDKTKEDHHEIKFLNNTEQVVAPIKQAISNRQCSPNRELGIDILGANSTTEVNSPAETTICKKCKLACTSHENLCIHYETLHKLPVVSLSRNIPNQGNPKCKRTEASNNEEAIKQYKTHKCGICSKTFTAPSDLKRHKSSIHDGKIFNCSMCPKTFHWLPNLKRHELSAHVGCRYTCNICLKTFSQLSHLNRHKSSIHDNVRFTCDICQKEFSRLQKLKQHKLNVHQRIMYTCNSCSQQFNSAKSLSWHKLSVHEGFRYKCELCDKQYRQGKNLRAHAASVHGGVRHKCDTCPKAYSYVSNLRQHMSLAHGEQRNSANSALKNFQRI